MRLRGWSAAMLIVIASATLSGCGETSGSSNDGPLFQDYVALGDSYTAAPGVDPAVGSGDCGRSKSNYPKLFAKANASKITDVSCSGATITDLTKGQQTTGEVLPPQLDAVTSTADLVTVGIGGNDLDLIGLAGDCVQGKSTCAGEVTKVQEKLAVLPARIAAVVAQIKIKAPTARVVLVGYPTMVAASAPCAALPVSKDVVTAAREVNRRLNEAVVAAAKLAKVDSLDLFTETAEHGLCSKDPWIAGLDAKGAQPLHPTIDEQQYVADQLAKLFPRQ